MLILAESRDSITSVPIGKGNLKINDLLFADVAFFFVRLIPFNGVT